MKRAPIVIALVAVVALGAYLLLRPRASGDGLGASGTVEATEASLGFQLAGRIAAIRAREGDRVKAGDTLAVLDRTELDARHTQAEAQLAAARALLSEMERGPRPEELAQAHEGDSTAAARHADAQRDLDRTQQLLRGGAVSQEAADKARLALDVARSQREQAAQQLQLVKQGPRAERVAAQRAAVAQAEAMVRQATAQLANAVVVAPFDGVVTTRHREPGEIVAPGAPVLTLANLGDRWVRIYIAENRLGAIRMGEPATITTDTYADRSYAGEVAFIASEAEFTPRNVQTTDERVKLVYAVKVRITNDTANVLKPGMPADVALHAAK
ncbi:MAG: HlyD family efflux transporter periplasmic adaptor subunit [Gemmatimonadetes bacterium]|nr:HlyD family efflux transporter periplasmic adaptor subunit [Gemmatimonadota bacterium]